MTNKAFPFPPITWPKIFTEKQKHFLLINLYIIFILFRFYIMLELAKDILSADTQRKLYFINELCGLTTSVDYKIAKIISSDDIMFEQTLVALIRTALIYAK